MTTKFSHHQNILQPKRSLNSTQVGRVQKPSSGSQGGGVSNSGTLTLNGITIGLPSVHHIGHCSSTASTKKGPSTMAKRNARERNRVKQVNQGFQTLRQHIPEGYRLKKMSKVDTLKCALNYIRSMERILEITPMSIEEDDSEVSYTLDDMNQHLDKICSETSISLDQSFSSFSENEESPCHFHHHHQQQASSLHHMTDHQQQCITTVPSQDNDGSFQNTTPQQQQPAILIGDNLEVPSDENYHPSPSFVRVVEIIQLQTIKVEH